MFSKLLVVLATAVVLSSSAPVTPELYSELLGNSHFMTSYKEKGGDFPQYMSYALNEFSKWSDQVRIPSSAEYQALVAAQNGNTIIPSDEKILLRQYLNNFFNIQAVSESTSSVNQASSSSVIQQSQSQSSSSSSQTAQSTNEVSSSGSTQIIQNAGVGQNVRQGNLGNQVVASANKEVATSVNSQQSTSSVVQKEEKSSASSVSTSNVAQNSLVSGTSQQGFAGNQNAAYINSGVATNKQQSVSSSVNHQEASSVNKQESSSVNTQNSQFNGISQQGYGNTGNQYAFSGNQVATNVNKQQSASSSVSQQESSTVNKQVSSVNSNNFAQNTQYNANSQQGYGNNVNQIAGYGNQQVATNVNQQQSASSSVSQQQSSAINKQVSSNSFVRNSQINQNSQQGYGYRQNQATTGVNNQQYHQENGNTESSNFSLDQRNSYNGAEGSKVFSELETTINQYGISAPAKVVTKPLSPEEAQLAQKEIHNAHYSFERESDNNMEGNYLQQVETRKDGRVYGKYSYDDSHFFVTRYYIADENGFRIVKEIVAPSKKAGQHLDGKVSVHVTQDGASNAYYITEEDIQKCPHLKPTSY